jgi:hypothetical protein
VQHWLQEVRGVLQGEQMVQHLLLEEREVLQKALQDQSEL